MKKGIATACIVLCVLFLASCAGPKGATGPAGASGTMFKIDFQYGVQPSAAYTGPGTSAEDTMIDDYFYNANYGGCNELSCGFSGIYAGRSLLRFNLSQVSPSNVKVDHAYLSLKVTSMYGAVTVTAYALTSDWSEGTESCGGAAGPGATWNTFSSAGGDFNPSAAVSNSIARVNTAPDAADQVIFSLDTAMVENWIKHPTENRGIIIKNVNEAVNSYINFASKDYAQPDSRPMLTVYYELP
jgi:hypothetical protein